MPSGSGRWQNCEPNVAIRTVWPGTSCPSAGGGGLGGVSFALFCVVGMALHFHHFRPRYLKRTAVILLLSGLWILVLAASRVAMELGWPFLYLIPIPLAAILVTVL